MNLKLNQDETKIESNVNDNVIETLYNLLKDKSTHNINDLIGRIEVEHGYQDAIDFLTSNYTKFHCNSTHDPYIRFADPVIQSFIINKLLQNSIGNGIGLTQANLDTITSLTFFNDLKNNTEITRFPELKLIKNIKTINSSAFSGCSNLEEIDLTNIEIINENLNHTNIKHIYLPNCTSITRGGIGSNPALISIDAPELLDIRASWAINSCPNLTTVNMPKLALTTIPVELFSYNENLQTFNVNNNLSSVTKISDAPFFRCKNLTFENYDFSNVTSIGGQAFRECIKLRTINLSTNCISIGDRAFYGCTSLTSVGDTSNVTSLGHRAFYGCSSLEQITLGDITYLAESVFENCTSLTALNIDWTKINRIDENAIRNTKLGLNETLELNLTNNTSYPHQSLSNTLYKRLILHMNNLGSYKGNIGDFDSRYPLHVGMTNLEYLDYSDTNLYSWASLFLGKNGPMETLILPSTIRRADYRCTYQMPDLQYLIILVEDPSLLIMNNSGSSTFNGNSGSSSIANIYVKDSNVRDLYLAHEFWGAIPNAENRIKTLSELPTGVWTTGLYQQYEPYLSNH